MPNKDVTGHMKKATSNLKSAQLLFDNGLYDEAVNTSYYAVFHGASALLSDKGLGFSKHKTLISKYNEIFVHPGLISSLSFRALTALFKQRMESEYNAVMFAGAEGAQAAIRLATEAMQDILDYCAANGIAFE